MSTSQDQRDAERARKRKNKQDQRARIAEGGKVEKTFAIVNHPAAFEAVARSVKRANNKFK